MEPFKIDCATRSKIVEGWPSFRERKQRMLEALLSPGGYRGQKAENDAVPVAATTLVALRLARAYKELEQWKKPAVLFKPGGKPCPQELLWTYLYQQGLEEL